MVGGVALFDAYMYLTCLNCLIFLIRNHVHTHTVYNRSKQTEREKQLFSLKGSDCRSQRMAIYSFLLSRMTDTHRFQLTAKLCQEVQEHTYMFNPGWLPVFHSSLNIFPSLSSRIT